MDLDANKSSALLPIYFPGLQAEQTDMQSGQPSDITATQVWDVQATKSEHIDEHDTCLEPLHSQGRKKGVRTCTAATPEVWRGGAGCPGKVSSGALGVLLLLSYVRSRMLGFQVIF